jgi:tetratricopeptide (TPR) repeat protein
VNEERSFQRGGLWGKNVTRPGYAIFAVLVVCLSVAAFERNRAWKDDLTLWSAIARMSPQKPRAHTNLGVAYDRMSDLDMAMEKYLKAIRLDPNYLYPYGPLAVIYGKRGKVDWAIEIFLWLLRRQPRNFKSHTGLGVAYMLKGRLKEADREFKEALRINPDYEPAQKNLDMVYRRMGLNESH